MLTVLKCVHILVKLLCTSWKFEIKVRRKVIIKVIKATCVMYFNCLGLFFTFEKSFHCCQRFKITAVLNLSRVSGLKNALIL